MSTVKGTPFAWHQQSFWGLILKHNNSHDNLPPCIFHGVLAEGANFEPKVGNVRRSLHESLNIKLPEKKRSLRAVGAKQRACLSYCHFVLGAHTI
jgi:hypothetical protein